MNRREFLGLATALPLLGMTLPASTVLAASTPAPVRQRVLVLVKLAGGNDGLNTLIPHADPQYYQYRPAIAIPRHQVMDIGQGQGINPYLKALLPLWNAGEMAWLQGVGYPHHDLSHFRSSDIWETAALAGEYATAGWLGQLLPQCKAGLHGIVIGESMGPMAGKDCHAIAMRSPQTFLSQVGLLEDVLPVATTPALAHLTNIQHQLYGAGQELEQKLRRPVSLGGDFSTSEIGRDLESVAKMILNGLDAAVYMVTLNGFDTHTNQLATQSNLLHHLAGGLSSFAQAMKRGGRWEDVLVVTYSEFGRRVQENHGKGTDHGTSSVQLVMGGKVRGGLYGDIPRLNDLDADGNLHYTVDFRQVYATLAQRWWGQQQNPWAKFATLAFV